MVIGYEMHVKTEAAGGSFDAKVYMEDRFLKQQRDVLFWQTDVQNVVLQTTGGFKAAEASLKESLDFDGMFERDIRNRTLAISIEDFRMKSSPEEGTTDVILPDRPVKPGDSWPGRFTIGGKTVKIAYVYLGEQRVESNPTYVIEARFNDPSIVQIKPYRFWVAQDDGRTVLSSGAAKVTTNGMVLNLEYRMRRISKYTAPG